MIDILLIVIIVVALLIIAKIIWKITDLFFGMLSKLGGGAEDELFDSNYNNRK
jgi:hypothetical protein